MASFRCLQTSLTAILSRLLLSVCLILNGIGYAGASVMGNHGPEMLAQADAVTDSADGSDVADDCHGTRTAAAAETAHASTHPDGHALASTENDHACCQTDLCASLCAQASGHAGNSVVTHTAHTAPAVLMVRHRPDIHASPPATLPIRPPIG